MRDNATTLISQKTAPQAGQCINLRETNADRQTSERQTYYNMKEKESEEKSSDSYVRDRLQQVLVILAIDTALSDLDSTFHHVSAISGANCAPALSSNNIIDTKFTGNLIFELFGHDTSISGQYLNLLFIPRTILV